VKTPYVDVWHDILRARREHDMPRATHIYMHPRDAAGLESDILASEHLRYSTRPTRIGIGLELFGVTLSIQTGVAEGWLIVEAERSPSGQALTMHHFRCLAHEDCRSNAELGIACLACPTETSASVLRARAVPSPGNTEEP
jgi:hypothetical protein